MRWTRSLSFLMVLPTALFFTAPTSGADDPLADILRSLAKAKDAGQRRLLATKLSFLDTPAAARRLLNLIRQDPDPSVRIAAADGLVRMSFEGIEGGLMEAHALGGIRGVREAMAAGIGKREDGLALLDGAMRAPGTDPLARGLAVRAMGWVPGQAALERLLTLVGEESPFLRSEALRGLASRRDMTAERWMPVLDDVLRRRRDVETLMAALDVIEDLRDPALLPVVERLDTFLDPALKEAVAHALAILRLEKWKREAEGPAREGYAAPAVPREGSPRPRTRFDLVFVMDATGSVSGHMERIQAWMRDRRRFLVQEGFDVRFGVVAYRDDSRAEEPSLQVLPLTYDGAAIEEFLKTVKPRGVDSQGAAIHRGLEQALDRMSFRWNGARSVYLVADSKCGDSGRTRNVVAIHRKGDGTLTHVLYLLRTRGSVPEDIRELAAAAGGTVEILE